MAKNISFHVGIGTFKTAVYPSAKALRSPRLDAREMYNLASDLGYTSFDLQPRDPWDGASPAPPNVLIDGDATLARVVEFLERAKDLVKDADDRCFITISSHGARFRNEETGPNFDGLFDEMVCLHDFTLRDDVLHGLLSQFDPGVNVILVLDCCHAGATSQPIFEGGILESVKKHAANAWSSLVEMTPFSSIGKSPLALGIRKDTEKPTVASPELAADLEERFKDAGKPSLRANVIAFQACGANEVTFDGAANGDLSVYTRKFVDAAKTATTLAQLLTKITDAEPHIDNCTPQSQNTDGFNLTISLRP